MVLVERDERAIPLAEAVANEIVLVPPSQLLLRRQRSLACREIHHDITADRYDSFDSLWPQRGHDLSGPRARVETADERLFDLERVHQRHDIRGGRGLLTILHRATRSEAPGAKEIGRASCRERA